MNSEQLSSHVLELDLAEERDRICSRLRDIVGGHLHRKGVVVAVSGGIDSSVSAALAVAAFGQSKVFALLMPERDSSDVTRVLGKSVVNHLGISYEEIDIAPTLEAIGCYQWRDAAIKAVFSEYGPGWKNKILISGGLHGGLNFFKLAVQSPDGKIQECRLPPREYLQIVAATNFKQRIRKTLEYFHADRLHYAVIGTPNRLEYDQGFFVKNGDGAADVKPIAHLYKSQVYAMARHLGLPSEVCSARPTTDTYSMPQDQDEFYFSLPHEQMDVALWAYNNSCSPMLLSDYLGCGLEQAQHIYRDIANKRRTTAYLHAAPILIEDVSLVATK